MTDTSPLWFDPNLCLIGGAWVPTASGQTLPLVNPSDGSTICHIGRGDSADMDAALEARRTTYGQPPSQGGAAS